MPKIKSTAIEFPEQINGFALASVGKRSTSDKYLTADYVDADGKHAIAKQWTGRHKNLGYYWLQNEIRFYKFLDQVYRESTPELLQRFPDIRVPKLIATIEEENRLVLLVEYIQSQSIQALPDAEQVKIYEKLFSYLDLLDQRFIQQSEIALPVRPMAFLILRFPLVALLATIRHPKIFFEVLRSATIFTASIPTLLTQRTLRIVHRDLNPKNILIRDGKIYLIDFELSVRSHPLIEIAHIMMNAWKSPSIWELLWQSHWLQTLQRDKQGMRMYKSLSLYLALLDLSLPSGRNLYPNSDEYLQHSLSNEHHKAYAK